MLDYTEMYNLLEDKLYNICLKALGMDEQKAKIIEYIKMGYDLKGIQLKCGNPSKE